MGAEGRGQPGASRQRPRGRGQSGRGQQTEANMQRLAGRGQWAEASRQRPVMVGRSQRPVGRWQWAEACGQVADRGQQAEPMGHRPEASSQQQEA